MRFRTHRSSNQSSTPRRAVLRLEPLEMRANPSVITVDDDGAQRQNADFSSIQAAVNAASPGDKIHVYAGTYHEQVVIPSKLNNLDLTAQGKPGSVKIAPTSFAADPTEAVVHVAGAKNVGIRGFVITGELAPPGPTAGADYGVLIDLGGSASVRDNHITTIRDQPMSGHQEGIGVQFGFTNSMGTVLSTGTGEVRSNLIDDYQKGGVVVIGAGSHANVKANNIHGAGATAVNGQNGIQISHGATAVVEQNLVTDNNYTGPDFVATGILIFQSDNVVVKNNTLLRNNEGIYLFEADNNVIDHNTSNDNTDDGIVVYLSNGNSVVHNVTSNNGIDGINIDSSSNNTVENNRAFDNGRYGIAIEPTSTNNKVRKNHLGGNGVDDLFVGNPNNDVSGNHFQN